jgi:hypothetical protein
MIIKINFKSLIIAIISFTIITKMVDGSLQSVIYFADALNEMAFTLLFIMITMFSLFLSFERVKGNSC